MAEQHFATRWPEYPNMRGGSAAGIAPLAEDFPNFVGKWTIFIFKNRSGHFFLFLLILSYSVFVSQGFSEANFLDIE